MLELYHEDVDDKKILIATFFCLPYRLMGWQNKDGQRLGIILVFEQTVGYYGVGGPVFLHKVEGVEETGKVIYL